MAALGCPGNMAAVVSAVEPMEEYVQVVVGEDCDPSQVVLVQGGGGELLRPVQELSPEILQSISHSDTVFYVQPDGSLLPGGSLQDVHTGVRMMEEAVHSQIRLQNEEAVQPRMSRLTGGHMAVQSEVSRLTGGHMAVQSEVSRLSGGHMAVQSEVSRLSGGHMAVQSEVSRLTGGQVEEAALSEISRLTGGHMAVQSEMGRLTGGQVEEAVLSEMSRVTGGHMAAQSEVSRLTGGHVEEAVLSALNLVTRGPEVETAHPGMILVPGDHREETFYPGVNLVTGVQMVEVMESGIMHVNGGQMVEAMESGIMRVNGGQMVESRIRHVNGGQMEELVHPGVSWVNGGQVHLGMDVVTGGGLVEEATHPAMITALNLTKEATQHSVTEVGRAQETATSEVSLISARAPEVAMQSELLPPVGTTTSGLDTFTSPVPLLKDAAQQLKTVAHHVALSDGDSVTRILNHKEMKSIRVQVPSIQSKKSADSVVLNLSTVHMKNANPSVPGTQVMQIKSLGDSGQPLVVNSSSLESPFQIFVRQAQLSAAKPRTADPKKNAGESLEEHQSYVAHPQNGTRASCTADHSQKKGHKRKKSIKIKTRSGRISRPPKHKAKDYKFLKVGDLIQDSTSDSEDYSELSTDEDEKGAKENTPCDLPPYVVKNTLFQCQTCEKSYMGKGGLSRHYRLYPSHGQMEPPFVSDGKKNRESAVAGHSVPSAPKKPTPRPRKRLLEDPLNPEDSSLPNLVTDGLEFVSVSTTCQGRRQITGKRFGRPRKILAIASSEQNALTAKELLQQCDDADLKEHVAPCFSERLSVHDFLLVKVKQEHPGKPLFPHLYKEFEKLHSMVRILAEEYFSNGDAGRTLEVADCRVAASLSISEEKIVKVSPPVASSVKEEQGVQSVEENESLVEEMMPPSKQLKLDEPESVGSTREVATGNVPDIHEAEQRADLGPMDDESQCVNDTSSDVTINCTEQVTETSHPNLIEEEVANLHTRTDPESIQCDMEQSLMETSPPLLSAGFPESVDSSQISIEHREETSSCAVQTQSVQDTNAEEVFPGRPTDHLPQPSAAALSSEEKTCSESFQGEDAFISPHIIASDQCSQAFGFHHGNNLIFVHSSVESATDEALVIYDGIESPANRQLETEVALVEMK